MKKWLARVAAILGWALAILQAVIDVIPSAK